MPLPAGNNPPRFEVRAVDEPSLIIDDLQASAGSLLFNSSCAGCHGAGLEATGRSLPICENRAALSWDAFRSVVHDGALAGANMPQYDDLTEADLRALYMYIRRGAREALPKP